MGEYEPYQLRILVEKMDLDDKIERLNTFIETPQFSKLHIAEQSAMGAQSTHMQVYSNILGERIDRFPTN